MPCSEFWVLHRGSHSSPDTPTLSVTAPQWMRPVICRCTTVDAACYLSLDHSGCSLLSVAAPQWVLPDICRCTTVDAACKVQVDEILPVTHKSRHSPSYFVETFQISCESMRLYTGPWVADSKQVRTHRTVVVST